MAKEITIDLTKATEELERMIEGKAVYNPGYLQELIDMPEGVTIEPEIVCGECDALMVYQMCSTCLASVNPDCISCNGSGGWFTCEECDG